MMLNKMTREHLLTQVNFILQSLSEVVSVLSQCQEDDVSSSPSRESSPGQDQDYCLQEEDLWWDESPSITELVSPVDSALYTLSYLSDDLSDVGQWSGQEESSLEDDVFSDHSYSVEEESSDSVSSVTSSEISSDSNTTWPGESVSWSDSSSLTSEGSQASSNIIDDLKCFIGVSAPAGVYNAAKSRRRKKRRCDKFVVPEMRSIWRNVATIFAEQTKAKVPVHYSQGQDYVVDWSKVNSRFLSNIPQAREFPVLGVSHDPSFYDEKLKLKPTDPEQYDRLQRTVGLQRNAYASGYNGPYFPNYHNGRSVYIHGTKWGHMTDKGVVPDPEGAEVHGHVYVTGLGWVLHARRQERDKAQHKRRGDATTNKNHKIARSHDPVSSPRRSSPRSKEKSRWPS